MINIKKLLFEYKYSLLTDEFKREYLNNRDFSELFSSLFNGLPNIEKFSGFKFDSRSIAYSIKQKFEYDSIYKMKEIRRRKPGISCYIVDYSFVIILGNLIVYSDDDFSIIYYKNRLSEEFKKVTKIIEENICHVK